MAPVQAVPPRMHTLTPSLSLENAAEALEFFRKAFGAEVGTKAMDPSGKKIWHSDLRIGSSVFFVSDTFPEMGNKAWLGNLWIYTESADALFDRAVKAGAKVVMPMADMFWGDRAGTLQDKWGNRWTVAQHIKDMTPEEMKKAQDAFVASMNKK